MVERAVHEEANRALSEALGTSFLILKVVLVAMVVLYPFSSVQQVRQHQEAVVLRLGRYRSTLGPGWHLTLPEPIDEVIKLDAARVQTLEVDDFWYARTREEIATGQESPDFPDSLLPGRDGYSLTGDANLLHTRWELRYRIVDPRRYLLEVHDPTALLRGLLRSSVTTVSQRYRIDAALYERAEAFRGEVEAELVRRLKGARDIGIEMEGVYAPAMSPPRQVRDAFDAVLQAEQERSRVINVAEGEAVRMRKEAASGAARTAADAEARASAEVARASAEADRFLKILTQARQHPDVVVPALYLDALRRTVAQVDRYLLESPPGQDPEIRILLNPQPRRAPRADRSDAGRTP